MLQHLITDLSYQNIKQAETQYQNNLLRIPHWDEVNKMFARLPRIKSPQFIVTPGGTIKSEANIQESQILELAKSLMPWRKGPFQINNLVIDAEWQSQMKWERLKPLFENSKGKVILDIGCNNGYFLYRIKEHNPKYILGIDPNAFFYQQFKFVQHFAGAENIEMMMLGVEELQLFEPIFDTILCAGIFYHRRDPLEMLFKIKDKLKKNGELILETITYPGEDKNYFIPKDRYAMMRNVWFLPTECALQTTMERVGFKEVKIINTAITLFEEQRSTKFMQFESLINFLDPNDYSKTIEGYPRPQRTIIVGHI